MNATPRWSRAAAVLLAVGWIGLWPAAALAHPLGLPAFAQITVTDSQQVTVAWNAAPDDVAALARSLGTDVAPGQVLTREQDAAFSASDQLLDALRGGLVVRQSGQACEAEVAVSSLVATGAQWEFTCPQPVRDVEVSITLLTGIDDRYRTLASATTVEGPRRFMFTSTVPVHQMTLDGSAGPAAPLPPPAEDVRAAGSSFGGSLLFETQFVALIDRGAGPAGLALGLLVALGVGGVHALAPGHGKAIGAAYLVGDRGRPRDAILLGTVVALMHTWSVLALGFALYRATQRPATALLSNWLQLVSGVLVAALGGWLLVRRLRERRHTHDHTHAVPDPGAHPLSWQGLVTLGAAGGLLPSPSALLVLFTALAVGRLAYGLSLIAAFSLGLGISVSVIGLAVLRGRDVLKSRFTGSGGRWSAVLTVLPLAGAAIVTLLGLVVAVSAVTRVFAVV